MGTEWLNSESWVQPPWADTVLHGFPDEPLRQAALFRVYERCLVGQCVDLDRVIGTSHARYRDEYTWARLLRHGKKSERNIRAYLGDPGYYTDGWRDRGSIHLETLSGGDSYYIMAGNHRVCMAKFHGFYNNVKTITAVSVLSVHVDWRFWEVATELKGLLNYKSDRPEPLQDLWVWPESEMVHESSEPGDGWTKTYEPRLLLENRRRNMRVHLDRAGAEALLEECREVMEMGGVRAWWRRFRRRSVGRRPYV